ncbi:Cysteine-rich receptor-like protein kinase 19 [Bienertia sinuspersici]
MDKGKLESGIQIAVKRLFVVFGQGLKEFMNEVVIISKLQHKNLVKLLGRCVQNKENMLVYEYMPNKSLDFFLVERATKLGETFYHHRRISTGLILGWHVSLAINRIKITLQGGYMSPEYAMEVQFYEKSDVHSFGVLLLDIIIGKRNSSFWLDDQSLTLLGYVSHQI